MWRIKNKFIIAEVLKMFSTKDSNSLITKVTSKLYQYHARVYIEEAPNCILDFYDKNKHLINGEVIVLRSKEDESRAAYARNRSDKVLFVFSDTFLHVPSYFSGTSEKINIPQALINRFNKS